MTYLITPKLAHTLTTAFDETYHVELHEFQRVNELQNPDYDPTSAYSRKHPVGTNIWYIHEMRKLWWERIGACSYGWEEGGGMPFKKILIQEIPKFSKLFTIDDYNRRVITMLEQFFNNKKFDTNDISLVARNKLIKLFKSFLVPQVKYLVN